GGFAPGSGPVEMPACFRFGLGREPWEFLWRAIARAPDWGLPPCFLFSPLPIVNGRTRMQHRRSRHVFRVRRDVVRGHRRPAYERRVSIGAGDYGFRGSRSGYGPGRAASSLGIAELAGPRAFAGVACALRRVARQRGEG